jgi:hypothetical protein
LGRRKPELSDRVNARREEGPQVSVSDFYVKMLVASCPVVSQESQPIDNKQGVPKGNHSKGWDAEPLAEVLRFPD